jgi:alpha-beta hydrolase superfamily lysophospholipase
MRCFQSSVPCRWLRAVAAVVLLLLGACLAQQGLPSASHTERINGGEIYYETYGSGGPRLLLHGLGGSTALWRTFVPELAKHYQVIAIDLRGHGRATNPEDQFTHHQAASDILKIMDRLKLDRVKEKSTDV